MASNPVRFVCGACGHWWHAVAWADALDAVAGNRLNRTVG